MIKHILLVGSGAWGQKYISILESFSNIKLTVANRNNWKQLIDNGIDGVIIATPPQSHIEIAQYALQKDIPVMIEKPLSLSSKEITKIDDFNIPILVNHIHLFSDAHKQIKDIIDGRKIEHISSYGFGPSPVRDYSSLWDYGPHDISIILDLINEYPNDIKAFEFKNGDRSLFDIIMSFNLCHSESTVGNWAEKQERTLRISFNGINIFYDDRKRPYYHSQPLTNSINIFIDAINGKNDYRLGLGLSKKVINILEMCDQSIQSSH